MGRVHVHGREGSEGEGVKAGVGDGGGGWMWGGVHVGILSEQKLKVTCVDCRFVLALIRGLFVL